ncbi:unnamed protein product [Phaeothamnion confervicola]
MTALLSSVNCPICMEPMADCVALRTCGHSFCRTCASEFLSRKKECAVCKTPAPDGNNTCIPNFTVCQLVGHLNEAATAASEQRLAELLSQAGMGASPIERLFVELSRASFAAYQQFYAQLEARHRAEVAAEEAVRRRLEGLGALTAEQLLSVSNDTGDRIAAIDTNVEAAAAQDRLAASRQRFERAVEFLSRDYERYVSTLAPPPSLLPAAVPVEVRSEKGARRRLDLLLQPHHTADDVDARVRQHFASVGDKVLSFAPDTVLRFRPAAGAAAAAAVVTAAAAAIVVNGGVANGGAVSGASNGEIANGAANGGAASWAGGATSGAGGGGGEGEREGVEIRPEESIFRQCIGGRPPAGYVLCIEGSGVRLQSELPQPCFAVAYARHALSAHFGGGGGHNSAVALVELLPETVDYYSCKTCGLNWVCAPCGRACHTSRGHDVRIFQRQHRPTWACCYCFKRSRTCPGSCALDDRQPTGAAGAAEAAAAAVTAETAGTAATWTAAAGTVAVEGVTAAAGVLVAARASATAKASAAAGAAALEAPEGMVAER